MDYFHPGGPSSTLFGTNIRIGFTSQGLEPCRPLPAACALAAYPCWPPSNGRELSRLKSSKGQSSQDVDPNAALELKPIKQVSMLLNDVIAATEGLGRGTHLQPGEYVAAASFDHYAFADLGPRMAECDIRLARRQMCQIKRGYYDREQPQTNKDWYLSGYIAYCNQPEADPLDEPTMCLEAPHAGPSKFDPGCNNKVIKFTIPERDGNHGRIGLPREHGQARNRTPVPPPKQLDPSVRDFRYHGEPWGWYHTREKVHELLGKGPVREREATLDFPKHSISRSTASTSTSLLTAAIQENMAKELKEQEEWEDLKRRWVKQTQARLDKLDAEPYESVWETDSEDGDDDDGIEDDDALRSVRESAPSPEGKPVSRLFAQVPSTTQEDTSDLLTPLKATGPDVMLTGADKVSVSSLCSDDSLYAPRQGHCNARSVWNPSPIVSATAELSRAFDEADDFAISIDSDANHQDFDMYEGSDIDSDIDMPDAPTDTDMPDAPGEVTEVPSHISPTNTAADKINDETEELAIAVAFAAMDESSEYDSTDTDTPMPDAPAALTDSQMHRPELYAWNTRDEVDNDTYVFAEEVTFLRRPKPLRPASVRAIETVAARMESLRNRLTEFKFNANNYSNDDTARTGPGASERQAESHRTTSPMEIDDDDKGLEDEDDDEDWETEDEDEPEPMSICRCMAEVRRPPTPFPLPPTEIDDDSDDDSVSPNSSASQCAAGNESSASPKEIDVNQDYWDDEDESEPPSIRRWLLQVPRLPTAFPRSFPGNYDGSADEPARSEVGTPDMLDDADSEHPAPTVKLGKWAAAFRMIVDAIHRVMSWWRGNYRKLSNASEVSSLW